MNYFAILAAFFLGILATLGVTRIYLFIRNLIDSNNKLVDKVDELTKQVQGKQLPYYAKDGLENAMAALNYFMFERKNEDEYITNALAHIQKVRTPDKKE